MRSVRGDGKRGVRGGTIRRFGESAAVGVPKRVDTPDITGGSRQAVHSACKLPDVLLQL